MTKFLYFFFTILFLLKTNTSQSSTFAQISNETGVSQNIIKAIKSHKIYSKSDVTSSQSNKIELQELKFSIAGLHTKSCKPVLRKLSIYENYPTYLDFVKEAGYNEKTKRVQFLLSSNILPVKMMLDFVLPRIDTVGVYPIYFDKGFLKGLSGLITIREVQNRCFFFTKVYWKGRHSKFPDFVFEFFSATLSKLAMENLFRISKTL